MKTATSFRLSEQALQLIKALARKLGISQTAVIEMAVRKLAEKEL